MIEDSFPNAAWAVEIWELMGHEGHHDIPDLTVKAHGEHAVWVMLKDRKIGWISFTAGRAKPWKLHRISGTTLAFRTFNNLYEGDWTYDLRSAR